MSPVAVSAVAAFGLLLVAAVALAGLAFSRPASTGSLRSVTYDQFATFSYTAATRSGVYDTAAAQTGDPVFIRLSEAVEVSIQYRFAAAEPHAVAGNYRVVARITGENGWRRTLPLTPRTDFTGDGFKAQVPLQIADLQYTIATTEHETGVTGRSYKVAIVPEIELAGTLAGQELKERFAPALTFAMDPLQLTVERAPEGPRATGPGATAAAADPFKPSQKGMVQRPGTKPNTLSILFITLKVQTARTLALAGTALAVLLGGVAGWLTLQARRADEPARIQSRYAPLMLKLAEGDPAGAGTRVVRVASIDDLVKVAGQEGRMILHKNGGLAHRYFVADGELVYEYATQSRPPVAAGVNGAHSGAGTDGGSDGGQDSGNGAGRGA